MTIVPVYSFNGYRRSETLDHSRVGSRLVGYAILEPFAGWLVERSSGPGEVSVARYGESVERAVIFERRSDACAVVRELTEESS